MHPMLWANDLRCVQKTCGDIYTCNHMRRLFICTAGIITPDNISRQQLLIQTSQIKEMQIVSRHYHLMISRIFPLESWATTLWQSRNPPPPWIPRPAPPLPPLRPNFPSRKVSNTLGPDFVLCLQLPSYCACATLIPLPPPSYKAVVLGTNVKQPRLRFSLHFVTIALMPTSSSSPIDPITPSSGIPLCEWL